MKSKLFKLFTVILALSILFVAACGGEPQFLEEKNIISNLNTEKPGIIKGTINIETETEQHGKNVAYKIKMQINIELYYDKAPNTVNNFISLSKNFYSKKDAETLLDYYSYGDGIYGGSSYAEYEEDEDGNKKDTPTIKDADAGYRIVGEMFDNGWERNKLPLQIGSLYMVLKDSNNYNSAENRFAISLKEDKSTDKKDSEKICVFGKVTSIALYRTEKVSGVTEDFIDNRLSINDEDLNKFLLIGDGNGGPVYIKSMTFENHANLGRVLSYKVKSGCS